MFEADPFCRVKLVAQAFNQCPGTQIVMSGYSQGAQVLHKSATLLPPIVMSRVAAVVTFGDPKSKTPVTNAQDRTLVICHEGDSIVCYLESRTSGGRDADLDRQCDNGDLVLPTHLTYSQDVGVAAAFVAKNLAARRVVKTATDGLQSRTWEA